MAEGSPTVTTTMEVDVCSVSHQQLCHFTEVKWGGRGEKWREEEEGRREGELCTLSNQCYILYHSQISSCASEVQGCMWLLVPLVHHSPPPSLSLSSWYLLHSSNITALHRQTQRQWLLGATKDTNRRTKNMSLVQSQSFPFSSVVSL